ncbi:hypothetical protein BZG01_13730 [Labilibaculum manganireducens]|uniref:DUF4138 domain-containing protein n=1 Tax=Labilibaculum manganireducens TaxID=1940525 RepID=A0A2N3I351_9BACT|nr:hypothetical protein [Labilibaculum manganireducens]PKQ64735.1 hypothetical protein BZG01_13730 [Labilibaculum manganireducens]
MLIRLLSTLFFIHLTASCSNQDKLVLPGKLEKQYPLKFEAPSIINSNGIFVNSGLCANASGDTLLFYGQIRNNRKSSIVISPYLLQIQTLENHRSNPISVRTKTVLLPDSSQSFVYKFTPINNKYLFSRTEKRGDLDSCYFIDFNFIRDTNGHSITNQVIKFNANEKLFSNYLNNFAHEHSITLYELTKEKLQSNFQFSETEIVMNGIVLTTKFYQDNDSLFLNLKLINHSSEYLKFSPDSIQITSIDPESEKEIRHQVVSAVTKSEGHKSILKKGDRLQTQLNFGYFKHPPLKIKVDFSTLKIHPQKIKVFSFNPTFRMIKKVS